MAEDTDWMVDLDERAVALRPVRVLEVERESEPIIGATAWDTIGAYYDLIHYSGWKIRLKGGRALYDQADPVRGYQTVRLGYLKVCPDRRVRQITRYVAAMTPVEIVPPDEEP